MLLRQLTHCLNHATLFGPDGLLMISSASSCLVVLQLCQGFISGVSRHNPCNPASRGIPFQSILCVPRTAHGQAELPTRSQAESIAALIDIDRLELISAAEYHTPAKPPISNIAAVPEIAAARTLGSRRTASASAVSRRYFFDHRPGVRHRKSIKLRN
jgi:hypothetical protein